MEFLFVLFAFAAGLLLVAAAFVALVDLRQAQRLLAQLRLPLVVILAVVVLCSFVTSTFHDLVKGAIGFVFAIEVLIGFAATSVIAYLIREANNPRRERTLRLTGLERKPVLPTTTVREPEEDEGIQEKDNEPD